MSTRTCHRIRPYLWLGGYNAPIPDEVTDGLGCGEDASTRHGFVRYTYLEGFDDDVGSDMSAYVDEACRAIDIAKSRGGVIYVHCMYGKSRSPAIVVAYLMRTEKLSFDEAFDEVDRVRGIRGEMNPSFIEHLVSMDTN